MKKVAIIGGGYTGLTAAYKLAKSGINVSVYERSADIGGLVAGFEIDGIPIEKAYHFLYKTDSDILQLAEELGIRDNIKFHNSSTSIYFGGKLYPFMTPMDLLRFTPLSFINRIRTGIAMFYLLHVKKWKKFTKITAHDWIKKWTGKEALRIIWEPLLRGKFDKYYDQIAMSWLWARMRLRGKSKDRGEVTEKLGYFDGGFRLLSDCLAENIVSLGGKIYTNIDIKTIDTGKNGTPVLNIDGNEKPFDAVLVTTPTFVFSNLIQNSRYVDKEYINSLKAIDYIGAVVMVFSSLQNISSYYWHNVNDSDIPFLVFLSKSALVGRNEDKEKHIYYIGAYVPHDHKYFEEGDAEIMNEWAKGLKKMFPEFNPDQISSKRLFKFKNAQHIVGINYDKKIPEYESVIPNVYLANFSQIFPNDRGTNYAVQEGNKISEIIMRKMNKKAGTI